VKNSDGWTVHYRCKESPTRQSLDANLRRTKTYQKFVKDL